MSAKNDTWPQLPLERWQDTYATLHLWSQIVGKVRLTQTPWINHSWHVTLYVTSRGLTTSPMPCRERSFQIDFDFIDHKLVVTTGEGDLRALDLKPRSVADLYRELFDTLRDLGLDVKIHTLPNEVPDPIPFEKDDQHAAYDKNSVQRYHQMLIQADRVFREFRARFIGKVSPVHYFWGAADLAVTRFSGRLAPPHPGGMPGLPDWITREAYSHEVSSAGFWPGGGPLPFPLFYSYAYPQPKGFEKARVNPAAAYYTTDMGEFVLPYDEVRKAKSPDDALLEFLQSTYEAAADLGKWDRKSLEREKEPGPE